MGWGPLLSISWLLTGTQLHVVFLDPVPSPLATTWPSVCLLQSKIVVPLWLSVFSVNLTQTYGYLGSRNFN